MQVVTEVGPHSSPELVPIAATPEPRSSSPAVPSCAPAGPRWGRERSATPGHQRTTAVNRRPGQSACQTIAAGPRTGLPALLRQRFGVRVPGGAPPSAPVRPGMPPGFSFGRLARARMGPAEGPKRPRLELQDRPSAAPCSPTACMASSRSRSSASWPSNRWPQRSSVNDTDVCPARTATSLGLAPAAIQRATAVWRSSWGRRGSKPAARTAGSHTFVRKFEVRSTPLGSAVNT
jgi:hypothetical protein